MEVDDFHSSKYSRLDSNGKRLQPSKIGLIGTGTGVGGSTGPTTTTATATATSTMGTGDVLAASTRFGRQWQHSSRIIRVSRASGGKDRHSKVWTAKGPRDRRVRLSVNTAIQFYDLQDRLGYDQPSKAVEWLIKAAAESINELPSLSNINFPPETTPRQLADEPRPGVNVVDSGDVELDGHGHGQEHQQQLQQVGSMSMSKSGCSSNNSETSKGSGLSLSRSEIRVKARERARERTAKEKDTGNESLSRVTVAAHHHQQQNNSNSSNNNNNNVSSMGQTASFTQLLTAGINTGPSSTPSPHGERERNLAVYGGETTTTTTSMADYCGTGFMGLSTASRPHNSIHQHLGNGSLPHVMTLLPFSGSHEIQHQPHQHQHQHQQQQQQLPFFLDHHHHSLIPTNTIAGGGSDYNLNFSISSSSSTTSSLGAGFNRGTLQSNSSSSPSFLSYLQRFSSTATDGGGGGGGSSVPFFLGGAPISPIVETQHQHHHYHHDNHPQFNPSGLHLNYGDAPRHSDDNKGKGKN